MGNRMTKKIRLNPGQIYFSVVGPPGLWVFNSDTDTVFNFIDELVAVTGEPKINLSQFSRRA